MSQRKVFYNTLQKMYGKDKQLQGSKVENLRLKPKLTEDYPWVEI